MKLSEKKRLHLYNAIADSVTAERLCLHKEKTLVIDLDRRLFDLQNEIWRQVHKALNLEGSA